MALGHPFIYREKSKYLHEFQFSCFIHTILKVNDGLGCPLPNLGVYEYGLYCEKSPEFSDLFWKKGYP